MLAHSKFGFLLGYSFVVGEGDPGFAAATAASILSAPFINPVRAGVSAARVIAARASEMRCLQAQSDAGGRTHAEWRPARARLWHAQVRMVEKQQRAYFKISGTQKPVAEILRESAAKNFAPLFRGTIPLMGHSFASAMLGLVGQPRARSLSFSLSFSLPRARALSLSL